LHQKIGAVPALGRLAAVAVVVAATAGLVTGAGATVSAQPATVRAAVAGSGGAAPGGRADASAGTPFSHCAQLPSQHNPDTQGPFPADVYVAGYADAGKLRGSEPLGPAFLRSGANDGLYVNVTDTFGPFQPGGPIYNLCQLARFHLDDNGKPEFPATTATFLGFGFMPVTATVQLTQAGLSNPPRVIEVAYAQQENSVLTHPYTVVTTAQVLLHVLSAKVNGVPLNVGGDCRTAAPLYTPDSQLPADMQIDPGNDLVVSYGGNQAGSPEPPFSSVVDGGAVAGQVTIPPFTGCGELDPLFTASVSGPGNYVKLTSGPVCSVGIFPCTPAGLPTGEPVWTVTHGSAYTGSGPVTFQESLLDTSTNPAGISCTGSTIAGSLPDASGPPRGAVGTFRWTGFSGCTGFTNPETGNPVIPNGSTWEISQNGTADLSAIQYSAGTVTGTVSGLSFTFKGTLATGQKCTGQLTEPFDNVSFTYTRPTLTISTGGSGGLAAVPGSNCPADVFSPAPTTTWGPPEQDSFTLDPGAITITSP
jgi:hypothetical protein